MNRNTIIAAGTALVLALILNNSRAQDNAPAPAPAPTPPVAGALTNHPVPPGFGPNPRALPPRRGQTRGFVVRAQNELRNVKLALQGSPEEYGGHKASAIAACDKALEELNEVLKSMPLPPNPVQRPGGQFQPNPSQLPPPGGNAAAPAAPAQAPGAPPVRTPEP